MFELKVEHPKKAEAKEVLEEISGMELIETFKHVDQGQIQEVRAQEYIPELELEDAEIDVIGFQDAWESLKDTHDFFGMLKTFKVTRTQALRLAPSDFFAKKMSNGVLRQALNLAAADVAAAIKAFKL